MSVPQQAMHRDHLKADSRREGRKLEPQPGPLLERRAEDDLLPSKFHSQPSPSCTYANSSITHLDLHRSPRQIIKQH